MPREHSERRPEREVQKKLPLLTWSCVLQNHMAAVEATQAAALALTARQIDECGCPGCPNKAPEDEAGRSQPEQSSQSLKG